MSEQIFVSYRREGGDVTAKLMCEALKNLGYTVFYDYDSINGGYFDSRILDAIEGCNEFVLVLPQGSLDRCVNENDWVRQEIAHALKHRKNIIPVMLPGFEFPSNMPEDIAPIARYNGVQFIMAYFEGVISAVVDRFTFATKPNKPITTKNGTEEIEGSEGLLFELSSDGKGYMVKVGTCTDIDVVVPRVHNGKIVIGIADNAFKNYTSLTSISLPDGIKTIGQGAFNGCSLLSRINFPASITFIDKWAFQDCTSLTSVSLPKSLTNIGTRAFLNCLALKYIDVDRDNNFYCTHEGHLFTKNMKTLVAYALGRPDPYYTVPDGVTKIEDTAFSRSTFLRGITLPESVTTISDYSFYRCEALTDINLPHGLTSLGIYAFSMCPMLESITVPGGVASIPERAFSECTSIKSITIMDGPKSIGDSAFSKCPNLSRITFPSTATSLGKWAFQDCTSLTEVMIPRSMTNIGSRAFLNCQRLERIEVDRANSFYCEKGGHLYTKDMKTLVAYAIGQKDNYYTVPDGVTTIEDSAFSRSIYLTNITIPGSVKRIETFAFCNCPALSSVSLGNGVNYIGESAFNACTSLTRIDIPASVTTIAKWAFDGCTAITELNIPKNVTEIGARAFLNCQSLKSINVNFWNRNYRTCDGHIFTKNRKLMVSYAIGCKNPSYDIPNGVTRLEDSSFSRCEHLRYVTIPASVTSLGEFTFHLCKNLATIRYNGTTEMWKRVTVEKNSFNKIEAKVINCTNGTVNIG